MACTSGPSHLSCRGGLPWIAGLALTGSLLLVLQAPRLCAPGALCAHPAVRYGLLALTGLGATLLILWLVYR